MTYHFTKTVDMSFDDAVMSTKEALKRHNFRVLTEIDMKDNLKKGLNVDFRSYLILGACNPELSYRALQAEDKIGTMLPCNVVLQQQEDGRVEVSAIDPVASMQAVTHVVLLQIAEEIRAHLAARFRIAVRVREIAQGRGFRVYQIRKPGNRYLVDVRAVAALPPSRRAPPRPGATRRA